MVTGLQPDQVTVFGQARLSNNTVVSSTIYMRESKSQSYWVNVYYGPEWLITPCRVKHYLRLSNLKNRRGAHLPTTSILLAVVEVYMCAEKLPYQVDEDARVALGESVP